MTPADPAPFAPDAAFPAGVRVVQTGRAGGASAPPYEALNLGLHVGDDPGTVRANRATLRRMLPGDPLWLRQVHGTRLADADAAAPGEFPLEADGATTSVPGRVVAVLTADCLPVAVTNAAGTRVAVVHAGWRGLAAGIVADAVAGFAPHEPLHLWLGPAIGPGAFEVGAEVREAFVRRDARHADAFRPGAEAGKHLADLYALARAEADAVDRDASVTITGGDRCTFSEPDAFFSHRRDGPRTGRTATLAWLEPR